MSARVTHEAGIWVDQSAAAAAQIRERATAAARDAWAQFDSWYDAAAVAAYAEQVAHLSKAGQETVTDLFAEYMAHVSAAVRDNPRITVPKVTAKPVRNGVDPITVHSRPASTFKETFALTGDEDLAIQRAVERGIRLLEDDLMLAARQAQQDAMEQLKVGRYRRVLRPELSESGPCGLCVVASGRIYHRKDLLPMHGRCKCQTLEIVGDEDPGRDINDDDLAKIYAAAGSTSARDLKRTRVTVSEHGELGPVLHVRGQKFTGPDALGAPPDPHVRERRMAAFKNVLAQLEQRNKDGEDVDAQVAEQHRLIDKGAASAAGGSGSGSDTPPAAPPAAGGPEFGPVLGTPEQQVYSRAPEPPPDWPRLRLPPQDNANWWPTYVPDLDARATAMLQYHAPSEKLVKRIAEDLEVGRGRTDSVNKSIDAWHRIILNEDASGAAAAGYTREDLVADLEAAATWLNAQPTVRLGTVYRGLNIEGAFNLLDEADVKAVLARIGTAWKFASVSADRDLADRYVRRTNRPGIPVLIQVRRATGVKLRSMGRMADLDESLLSGKITIEDYDVDQGMLLVTVRWDG